MANAPRVKSKMETLRQRMDEIGSSLREEILNANVAMFNTFHVQLLLVPDIECNTIWRNLGWNDDDIIKGYHAHGECEQFHSEIKTDMDVERLPSGKFDTNELVLGLCIFM